MREIKFRGIHKSSNTFVYGNLLVGVDFDGKPLYQIEHTDPNAYSQWEVIPETIGQFTGLLDKSGKEIYEGDVLKCYSGYTWQVYWHDEHACFAGRSLQNKVVVEVIDAENMQVIRNIHQNQELLNN